MIRDKLKDWDEEQKARLAELAHMDPHEHAQKIHLLTIKAKRPGLAHLLGAANPLADEDAEELKKNFRLGRS